MARDSSGSQNQPHYSSSGVSSQAADLTEVSDFAAANGNRKKGTASQRAALTGADVWVGLEFYETDTALTWLYTSSGWSNNGTIATMANLTPATGWTAGTGVNAPRLIREGNQVTLYGILGWTTGGSYSNMLTIPAAFLPPTLTASRFIGTASQVTGTALISFLAIITAAGVLANGAGSSGSLPASGTVYLTGLSWTMD
jgi:hypothetical protein